MYQPNEAPHQASEALRNFLRDELADIGYLLNNLYNEDQVVEGSWDFKNLLTVSNDESGLDAQLFIDNDSTADGDIARIQVSADGAAIAMFAGNANQSAIVTGGPTGEQGVIRMLGADPIVFGTSNTARAIIQGSGEFDILGGNRLRIFDSTGSDVVTLSHNGTNLIVSGTNTGDINVINLTGSLNLQDGLNFRIWDAGDTDYVDMSHDGTNFLSNFVNTGIWNITNLTTGVQIRDGARLRIFNSADTDYLEVRHDGTDVDFIGVNTLDINFESLTGYLRVPADSGIGSAAHTNQRMSMHRVTLADDASDTIVVPTYAHIKVVTNYNRTADIDLSFTSTQAPAGAYTGTLASVGTGSNPDVDGDANYWKSNSSNFNIKNRLGSTRTFNVYVFGGA